jgi:hypothetical protein
MNCVNQDFDTLRVHVRINSVAEISNVSPLSKLSNHIFYSSLEMLLCLRKLEKVNSTKFSIIPLGRREHRGQDSPAKLCWARLFFLRVQDQWSSRD